MSKDTNFSKKKICVVLDSNIWRSELLLKTTMGHAFVYTLSRQKHLIGLPEVIERELKQLLLEVGKETAVHYEKHARILETLADGVWVMPVKDSQLEASIEKRLKELDPLIIRVPFTLDHALSALDMVVNKMPPNGIKDQQFKDSAVWQSILKLGTEYLVFFITNDSGFFKGRKTSAGLAFPLRSQCESTSIDLELFTNLSSCLKLLRGEEPSINKNELISLIDSQILPQIINYTKKTVESVGPLIDYKIEVFQTEGEQLAVDFSVVHTYTPTNPAKWDQEGEYSLVAEGTCYSDPVNHLITKVYLNGIDVKWNSKTGRGVSVRSLDGDPELPFKYNPLFQLARSELFRL
jgi:hypothetical protein